MWYIVSSFPISLNETVPGSPERFFPYRIIPSFPSHRKIVQFYFLYTMNQNANFAPIHREIFKVWLLISLWSTRLIVYSFKYCPLYGVFLCPNLLTVSLTSSSVSPCLFVLCLTPSNHSFLVLPFFVFLLVCIVRFFVTIYFLALPLHVNKSATNFIHLLQILL